jgi:tetratricopeptide (TPR) repeat protein
LPLLAEARKVGDLAPWIVVESYLAEGRAQVGLHNLPAAEVVLLRAEEMTRGAAGQLDWPQRPDALLALAELRAAQQRPDDARKLYAELVDTAPDSLPRLAAERRLVDLDLAAGKLDSAAPRVDAYLKAFPWEESAPWLLDRLGRAALATNHFDAAMARFDQLRRDYAGSEAAVGCRGPLVDALRGAKQYDRALTLLDEVLTVRPEMLVVGEASRLKAETLAAKGDTKAAVAALDEPIGHYGDTFVAQRLRLQQADLLRRAGDGKGEIARLQALDKAFPQPYWHVAALRALLNAYSANKDYDDAEDTADALAKLCAGTPLGAQALFDKAQCQHDAGRVKPAKVTLDLIIATYKGAPYVPLAKGQKASWN